MSHQAVSTPAFFGDRGVVSAYAGAIDYRPGEAYVLDTFLRPGGDLLEVGCGAGRVAFLLAPRFRSVEALDVVPAMIAAARTRLAAEPAPIHFFVGDATAMRFDDASFDNVVFAHNGIESIPTEEQRLEALREVHRVLRPGGRFVFTTNSIFTRHYLLEWALKPRIKRALSKLGRYPEQEILPFGDIVVRQEGRSVRLHTSNPFRMKSLLRELGFEVVYFNSEKRLVAGRTKQRFTANFGGWDQFYVCEKR